MVNRVEKVADKAGKVVDRTTFLGSVPVIYRAGKWLAVVDKAGKVVDRTTFLTPGIPIPCGQRFWVLYP